jgi:hypothetical protein
MNQKHIQAFCEQHPHCSRKSLDPKVLLVSNNLEQCLRKEFDMKVASFKNILDEFQEENKALREEVLLLREGLMETLDLLVKHKSRTNLQETFTTETVDLRT